jgi:hypothetical protein
VKRTVNRLTTKQVSNAQPPKGRSAMLLADGGSLYLQCTIGQDGRNDATRDTTESAASIIAKALEQLGAPISESQLNTIVRSER